MLPIREIAKKMNLEESRLVPYGHFKAKISLDEWDMESIKRSKLILVTSITPTQSGNGKTATSIGLADGLNRLGKKTVLALREPSLGPCFGAKGGGTGGGKTQLIPADDINLHFNGDFHAVSVSNNMLAALLDNYNFHAQGTHREMKEISWKRVLDINDRSLRYIITGLHGGKNGLPTETGFDITAASELMAVLCLSDNLDDLRKRIDAILLGYTADNHPLTVQELKAGGAIVALMKDAMFPNLVQTLEGTPAILHGGPFANIAHGCNSIIATRTAMQYGEYVLTEAGFGSDLGAEKFFNIVCRQTGWVPALTILVITTQALKWHGGLRREQANEANAMALQKGMQNLEKHIQIVTSFGQRILVVLNEFESDTDEEIKWIGSWCKDKKIDFVCSNAYNSGGEGAVAAAQKIIALTQSAPSPVHFTYDAADSIENKIRNIVQKIYGGKDIALEKKARHQLKSIQQSEYAHLPVCIAKTQYSLTDDPDKMDVYSDFIVTVDELIVNAGAGFIVVVCGEIMRMPGLTEQPNAYHIDVIDEEIIGLS